MTPTAERRIYMRKRTNQIIIRLSDEELAALNEKASRVVGSRESFCRHILNGAVVKEAPSIDSVKMLMELRRIGYNLNQVLKRANSIGLLDVPELRKVIDEVWLATRSILDVYTTEQR